MVAKKVLLIDKNIDLPDNMTTTNLIVEQSINEQTPIIVTNKLTLNYLVQYAAIEFPNQNFPIPVLGSDVLLFGVTDEQGDEPEQNESRND